MADSDDEITAEDVAAFSLALSRLFSEGALHAGRSGAPARTGVGAGTEHAGVGAGSARRFR